MSIIFLGIKLLRAGLSPVEVLKPAVPDSMWRLFGNTWLVTALNPKGMVFFVAFLQSRRAKRGFNIAGGSLLSIAGAWALLARRS
jgi:threonine/homoserine/homoserine lactone efflux protein